MKDKVFLSVWELLFILLCLELIDLFIIYLILFIYQLQFLVLL